jgi:hypothetical protein
LAVFVFFCVFAKFSIQQTLANFSKLKLKQPFANTRQTKSPKLALGASVYGGFLGLNLCDL